MFLLLKINKWSNWFLCDSWSMSLKVFRWCYSSVECGLKTNYTLLHVPSYSLTHTTTCIFSYMYCHTTYINLSCTDILYLKQNNSTYKRNELYMWMPCVYSAAVNINIQFWEKTMEIKGLCLVAKTIKIRTFFPRILLWVFSILRHGCSLILSNF